MALLDVLCGLEPCLTGMEACPTAHFFAREITAFGQDMQLIPPVYVTPYVKRQKMGWLPPSPDGIAMCQVRGVQRHEKERTAELAPVSTGHLGIVMEA